MSPYGPYFHSKLCLVFLPHSCIINVCHMHHVYLCYIGLIGTGATEETRRVHEVEFAAKLELIEPQIDPQDRLLSILFQLLIS